MLDVQFMPSLPRWHPPIFFLIITPVNDGPPKFQGELVNDNMSCAAMRTRSALPTALAMFEIFPTCQEVPQSESSFCLGT